MASSNMHLKVPMRDIAKRLQMHVTVTVTGMRWWKVRAWLGIRCFWLGAWVMGCPITVETTEAPHG